MKGRDERADLKVAARVLLRSLIVDPAPADVFIRGETTSNEVLAELDVPWNEDGDDYEGGPAAHDYARALLSKAPSFLEELLRG